MSFKDVAWARALNLPSTEKYVLIMLALRTNDEQICYPSVAQICADTGLDRKTVMKNLNNLMSKQCIKDTGKRTGTTLKVRIFQLITDQTKNKVSTMKPSQKRDDPKNGMIPIFPINSTNFGTRNIQEDTQKEKTSKKEKIAQPKNVATRKCVVPKNFTVTIRHHELAKKNGWPNPDQEVEAFIDYHLSKRSLYHDWNRAFNTWLRNAQKFNRASTGARKNHADEFWKSIPDAHYPDFTKTDDDEF